MNHLHQEGTDEHNIKVNARVKADVVSAVPAENQDFVKLWGAESCLCSCIQIKESLKS